MGNSHIKHESILDTKIIILYVKEVYLWGKYSQPESVRETLIDPLYYSRGMIGSANKCRMIEIVESTTDANTHEQKLSR